MDANQQVIQLFEDKIDKHYQKAKQLLLKKINYSPINQRLVDSSNMENYFSFLESSLKRPYNRFTAMYQFIRDDDEILLIHKMYPLLKLRPEIRLQIDKLYRKTCKVTQGLDESQIDPEFKIIQREEHE